MLDGVRQKLGWAKKEKAKSLAVFIDGPNILRKELQIDLKDIKKVLRKFGEIKVGKVFLNQYASEKLVEAVVNQGFESIITVGDIDVAMAVEATEAIFNPTIQSIAFVSRDSDFWPAVIKAKRYGKDTIVVLAEEASASALKNTADHVVIIGRRM
ncbi:TIGR00288 family NYN domain-containing protein [Candidatus Micrarchaeota archaeon]|nr:TIGR00288 family NYN domain-containing protein [Candidatus Micrarchaeota archaeon]MBU1930606.1 TIGR00288 family NYN domain-containing protein [Candidatus Micrarchaeota archaeon]